MSDLERPRRWSPIAGPNAVRSDGSLPRRRAGIVLALVLTLLAGACSGADGDDAAENGTSPLAHFLGLDGAADLGPRTDVGLALAALAESERQEAIAECMAGEGFEYIPVVVESDAPSLAFDPSGTVDRQWLERYGFGISTLWYWQDALPEGLIGYTVTELDRGDPNLAIVAELSEAEEQAYGLALYGEGFRTQAVDDTTVVPASDDEPDDAQDLGCHGTAGPTEIYEELSLDFGDELADMEAAIELDPRVLGIYDEIASCVRRSGLEFANPTEAISRIDQAMQNFDAGVAQGVDPDQPGQRLQLTPEQQAELAAIQSEEVALATTVDDCGGSGSDARETLRAVRHQHEANFVERNRDSLERFRDSYGA